jgi:YbbR domain-containing protein
VGVRVEEKVERVLSGIPVMVQTSDGDPAMAVDPTTIAVTLQGARTLVNAVDPADLRAWVASELVRALVTGEERKVPVRIEGVPALVAVRPAVDVVTVRRAPAGRAGGPPGER